MVKKTILLTALTVGAVAAAGDAAGNVSPIVLAMQKVPFSEVLRYMGDLAEVQFKYEQYAVVVKPKGAAQPVTKGSGAPEPEGGVKIQGL